MKESEFHEALKNTKIPVLVLDQKWHRLFAINGKPSEVVELETKLKELLAEQGRLNTELKEYRKAKSNLMQGVRDNMIGAEGSKQAANETAKLEENKRLIEEANSKIEEIEDQMLELPKEIKATNEMLMLETMSYCYSNLRTNSNEIDEIANWIKDMRVELKKNIIRKQNREINNKEIYAYMNAVFGKDVIDLFDVKYDEKNFNPNQDIGSNQDTNKA